MCKEEPLPLRPHHSLCFQNFAGEGYSSGFTLSLARIRDCLMKDPDRNVIRKTRYLHEYRNQVFEIDMFPFWEDRALMELELSSEDQAILLPPDIAVVRDVTSEKNYTNAAIARSIPYETL